MVNDKIYLNDILLSIQDRKKKVSEFGGVSAGMQRNAQIANLTQKKQACKKLEPNKAKACRKKYQDQIDNLRMGSHTAAASSLRR